jgi:hypothetical protein
MDFGFQKMKIFQIKNENLRKLIQGILTYFKRLLPLNTMQEHECNNQGTCRAHFTRLTSIYNKITLLFWKKKRKARKRESNI